jgi:hypothetical protein
MIGYKDPLQSVPTAYEILGLQENYHKKEVDAAFGRALKVKEYDVSEIRNAHSTLKQKLSRVKHDLLLYNAGTIQRLEKCDTIDPAVFDPMQRLKTAKRWDDVLKNDIVKRNVMDLKIVHALGILWLQWFLSEQKKIFASVVQSVNNPPESDAMSPVSYTFESSGDFPEFPVFYLGRQVIAYWGVLYDNPDFYRDFGEFFSRARAEIQSVTGSFILEYHELKMDKPRLDLVYARLETLLAAELRTALILRKYRFHSSYYGQLGRFGGREMMMHLEVQDEILKVLKNEAGEDKNLAMMKNCFLPYFDLHYLLYEDKVDLLRYRLRTLSDEEKQSDNFRKSALHLYLALVKQAAVNADQASLLQYTKSAIQLIDNQDQKQVEAAASTFTEFATVLAVEYLQDSIRFLGVVKQHLKHPLITETYSKLVLRR